MSVTKVGAALLESGTKGADIASATTVVIGTDGSYFDITGSTGISTQFTVDAGRTFTLQFDGAVVITDNAAITLSGGSNFTTAAGDILTFAAVAANTVVQTGYSLVDGGSPVAAGGGGNKVVFLQAYPLYNASFQYWDAYPGAMMNDNAEGVVAASWSVRDNITAISEILVYLRSTADASVNGYLTFKSSATGNNEDNIVDTDTISITTYAFTHNDLQIFDVTAMANGLTLTADHILGFQLNRSGAHSSDTINNTLYCFGFQVTYT